MLTTIAYTVLLVTYMTVIMRTKARPPGPNDRQVEGEDAFIKLTLTLNLVWLASFSLPYIVAPLDMLEPLPCVIIGSVLFAVGLLVRTIAMRTLGHYFTFKLTIRTDHQLVKSGIYNYIRHPSYTGTLFQLLGMMIAARSWAGLVGISLSAGVIILLRIGREEKMLAQVFGEEYIEYQKKTKR